MHRTILTALAVTGLTAAAANAEAATGACPEPLTGFLGGMAASGQFEGAAMFATAEYPDCALAYGYADPGETRANSETTAFHIASVTKAFTAILVLQAAERGEIDLDRPASAWLPELNETAARDITIRQLLTHTSGLMRDHAEMLGGRDATGISAVVEAVNGAGLMFEPGTRYSYSNTGYHLLALALERATGQSYADLLRERITQPAQMTRTGLGPGSGTDDFAIGIIQPDTVTRIGIDPDHIAGTLTGAGGVFATAPDLVRLTEALEDGRLLSPEMRDLMLAPIEAEDADGSDAMGWMLVPLRVGGFVYAATGASEGYLSQVFWSPDHDFRAALLQNNDTAGRTGSIAQLYGAIRIGIYGDGGDVPDTPIADLIDVLRADGPEAAANWIGGLDLSEAPVASAAAHQAIGAPDGGVGETPFAWAPATADAGAEWLELGFDAAGDADRLDMWFTQIPDALTGVDFGTGTLPLAALDATRRLSEDGATIISVLVPEAWQAPEVRLILDTSVPGWPQIDAAALTGGTADQIWAVSARASTSAFMSGSVSIHDLPTPEILEKLGVRLRENGQDELADAVARTASLAFGG